MIDGERFGPVFWKIRAAAMQKPRYISNRGGTRSGKTYATLQFLNYIIPQKDKVGDVSSVVSETLPHLKRGAIRDFEEILGHPLKTDPRWNASDLIYTYDNGAILEFFSADQPQRCQGPKRKRLFCNEANHISWETFRQLAVRTTGLILIDYNPDQTFWGIERIETRDNCAMIISTYLDNKKFLSQEQVDEIEANKNDARWWKVYGLGEIGSLDGLIYEFEQIDAMPPKYSGKAEADKTEAELYADSLEEIQGLDFGFSVDPTARVQIYADKRRKHLYCRQRCYRRRMDNNDIADDLRADGVRADVPIYTDCAEPKSISEIGKQGFNVLACSKDAPVKSHKRKFQIQWLQGWKLFVTKDSIDMVRELRNYTWAQDKDGHLLPTPIEEFDHTLDALRYAVWTRYGENAQQGQYAVGSVKGGLRKH